MKTRSITAPIDRCQHLEFRPVFQDFRERLFGIVEQITKCPDFRGKGLNLNSHHFRAGIRGFREFVASYFQQFPSRSSAIHDDLQTSV